MSSSDATAPPNRAASPDARREFARSSDGYDARYLLGFDHGAFVEYAYLAILDRPSDVQGRASAMKFLENGGHKVMLLGGLRYSDEGRARGMRVRGLRARFLLHRAYRIPVFGYLLESIVLMAALPRVARHSRALAFRAAARIEDVKNDADGKLAQSRTTHERELDDERAARMAVEGTLQALDVATRERAASFEAKLAALQDVMRERAASFETSLAAAQDVMRERAASFETSFAAVHDVMRERAASLETEFAAFQKRVDRDLSSGHMPTELDEFYIRFEEAFRGSREEIKNRVAVYLPRLAAAGAGSPDRPVLDLGCGRGEWLELLQERGLAGRGVDLNKRSVDVLRGRGSDVVEADMLEYLRNSGEASHGAITGMHVVEHLPFPVLVELVDQARRVLKPGGLLIFETPNPRNVLVASHTFYLDPTHRNPIPSALLAFVLESRGFTAVEVVELHPSPHEWSGIESEFDRYLIANLFGPQDYAVIGRTPRGE